MSRSTDTVRVCSVLLLTLVLALGIAGTTGCNHYTLGFRPRPGAESVAIGQFENRSPDASVGTTLRGKLAEAIVADGTVELTASDSAASLVRGSVVGVRSRRIAAVKRSDSDLSDYQSEYRSTVFRASVVVRYELVSARENNRQLIPMSTVVGEADYPETPDIALGQGEAVKQALADAARQIAAAIAEGW